VLSSFKHVKGEGHDKKRYHPIIYSLYWRSAVRTYIKYKNNKNIEKILFEDLINNFIDAKISLNQFLDTTISNLEINKLGNNSSFKKGKQKEISESEIWLCQIICKNEMKYLGYQPIKADLKLKDILELLRVSITFSLFQTKCFLNDKNLRRRIITVAANLLKRN